MEAHRERSTPPARSAHRASRLSPPDSRGGRAARGSGGQVDAELFLAVSARLRGAYQGLATARLSAAGRARWQSRLIAITDAAKRDLSSAARQLDRFEDEFRRETAA